MNSTTSLHKNHVNSKIISGSNLLKEIAYLRFLGKRIVFTNGCFDILHRGHIEYLMQAADLGDALIIGLNSDSSVKRLKGPERPVQDEQSRALLLASLQFVSLVSIFEEDTPLELIKSVQPDVLVKGGDYKNIEEIVGYDIVKSKGGEILTIPFVDGFSTTSILNKRAKL